MTLAMLSNACLAVIRHQVSAQGFSKVGRLCRLGRKIDSTNGAGGAPAAHPHRMDGESSC